VCVRGAGGGGWDLEGERGRDIGCGGREEHRGEKVEIPFLDEDLPICHAYEG